MSRWRPLKGGFLQDLLHEQVEASFQATHSQKQDGLPGAKWPHAIKTGLHIGNFDIESAALHAGMDP